MKDIKIRLTMSLITIVAFLWFLPSVGKADDERGNHLRNPLIANLGTHYRFKKLMKRKYLKQRDDEREVDCGDGYAIAEKLDKLKPGDTLTVTGVCNENLVIPEEIHRVTLDGQGMATINGPDATAPTLTIRGKGITIIGFTINGGRNGISVSRGEATIESNAIQDTGRHGISVNSHSFARIIDTTIKDTRTGVLVGHTSTVRMGFTGPRNARVPRPNTITGNRDGIVVQDNSFADIGFSTISNNTRRGVRVVRGSSARLGGLSDTEPSGNLIQNNGREGIQVFDSTADLRGNTISDNGRAGIELRASSAVIELDENDTADTPNTISNNGQDRTRSGIDLGQVSLADVSDNVIKGNSGDGITLTENSGVNLSGNSGSNGDLGLDCTIGAYASGSIGTLTGTSGAAAFDPTCIENLSDFP